MEERCDQIIDCKDESDEDNCKLLVFKKSYKKKVPPITIDTEDKSITPVMVNVSTSLMNVLDISEFSHTIELKLGITIKWYENRVLYYNLKSKEALNIMSDFEVLWFWFLLLSLKFYIQLESIWIPHILFKNTDTDEAVTLETTTLASVTREGPFIRSGPEVADEVMYCVCERPVHYQ